MKKLLAFLFLFAVLACKKETPKDYATLSGKIMNQNSDSLLIYQGRAFSKTIKVNTDGSFKDTLKIVKSGLFAIYDGTSGAPVFLENDIDLKVNVDAKTFDKSLNFSGKGHENSNFLIDRMRLEKKLLDVESMKLMDLDGLEKEMTSIKDKLNTFLDSRTGIDSTIMTQSKNDIEPMLNYYKKYIVERIKVREALPKGMVSPAFKNYENANGNKTSLADLKGKYVYIDVWATWCEPCVAEIPALKKLEEDYADKNVTFVSLSVDDDRSHKGSWDKAKEAWKAMVKEKVLTGIHIIAPEGLTSQFVKDYKINGIPRFVLIDPSGNIVNPDAPKPSDSKLRELFTSLNI